MARYMRVTIKGALPGGEVWSVNPIFLPLMGSFVATPTALAAAAAAVDAVVPPSILTSVLSNVGSMTGVRLEARTSDFALEGVGEHTLSTPRGGTGAINKPLQTSLVLSLRTPFPGASARGRLYWPILAGTQDTATGRLPVASAQAIADAAAVYLTDIEEALAASFPATDTWHLVVYSRTGNDSHMVTRVQVGDTWDTQRRRRDAIRENYSSSVYPRAS